MIRWLTKLAWLGRLPWSLVNLILDLYRGIQVARAFRGRGRGKPDAGD